MNRLERRALFVHKMEGTKEGKGFGQIVQLVTLQPCWMHLLFVVVVFQIMLWPTEMNGIYCIVSFTINVAPK